MTPSLPYAFIDAFATPKPLYYLPYRLLRSQEEAIVEQIKTVKESIKVEQETWATARVVLDEELRVAVEKMESAREAKLRSAEELEQLARREEEAIEEQQAKAAAAKAAAAVVEQDVNMTTEGTPVVEKTPIIEGTPVVLEIKNIAKSVTPALEMEAAVEEPAKMDVEAVEEEIEY